MFCSEYGHKQRVYILKINLCCAHSTIIHRFLAHKNKRENLNSWVVKNTSFPIRRASKCSQLNHCWSLIGMIYLWWRFHEPLEVLVAYECSNYEAESRRVALQKAQTAQTSTRNGNLKACRSIGTLKWRIATRCKITRRRRIIYHSYRSTYCIV